MFGWLKAVLDGRSGPEPPVRREPFIAAGAAPATASTGDPATPDSHVPVPVPGVASGEVEAARFASGAAPLPEADAAALQSAAALLRRTAVLDREQNLVGYSFELREDLAGHIRAPGRQGRDLVDGLLVDQIDRYGRSLSARGRDVCLRVSDGFLGQDALQRLRGLRAVLLVQPERPNRPASEELRVHAARLRETAGVRIVLDYSEAGPWLESMLPLADAALFRMGFCAPEELAHYVRQVGRWRPGMPVWAWEVGTRDDHALAHRLGCAAFSGNFVLRRDDWQGNGLSPHGLRLAVLLDRLRSGVDTREIAEVLKHDMALAYRLLRYVNAAAWGLSKRITTVEQAIVLLGQQPLQRWVSMMLLGSAGTAPGAAAVMEAGLVRARFLELLGALRGERDPAAQLFVLGLFSMLDVALRMPLADAIEPLKLSEAMRDALLRRQGPMAPWLDLAVACERADAERVRVLARLLGVSLADIGRLQFEALEWVQSAEA